MIPNHKEAVSYKENRNYEVGDDVSMWIINLVCVILTLLSYDSKEKIQSLVITLRLL